QDRLGDVELEGEEPLPERLPLVVHSEREGSAAAQGVPEKEVERAQAGQLVPLDGTLAERREVASHALGVERATEESVRERRARRDADVRVVALVTRAREGDSPERNSPDRTAGHRDDLAGDAVRPRRASARTARQGRRRELPSRSPVPAKDLDP